MEEIVLPLNSNETGGSNLQEGYGKYAIPAGLTTADKVKLSLEFLQNVVNKEMSLEKKIEEYRNKVEEYKKDLEKQSLKNIETIGIFSAILALLIIDVSVVKSVDSFLSAILLITGLTCSVIIFVSIIHKFFTPKEKINFGKFFWLPTSCIFLLILLGIVAYLKNWF
jgi:hypothetical protein